MAEPQNYLDEVTNGPVEPVDEFNSDLVAPTEPPWPAEGPVVSEDWLEHPLLPKVLEILARAPDRALQRWMVSANVSGFIRWIQLKVSVQRDFARDFHAVIHDPGYVNREIQRIVNCSTMPVNEMILAREVAVSAGWATWIMLYATPVPEPQA